MANADEDRPGGVTPDEQYLINLQKWKNYELERARELSKLIASMIEPLMRLVMSWLEDNAELYVAERDLIRMHLEQLSAHSAAIRTWENKYQDREFAFEEPVVDRSSSPLESEDKEEDRRSDHHTGGNAERCSASADRNDSILRNRIADEQVPLHSALAGLNKSFLQSAAWSGPTIPAASKEHELRMVRLPNADPDPCAGAFMTAVDDRLIGAFSAQQSRIELVEHWAACLAHVRPSPLEWHKSGAVVWDHLTAEYSSAEWTDWTLEVFNFTKADDATIRACHAALLGTFLTGDGAVRLETVKDALSTFIHAHPAFKTSVEPADWHLPYGKNTLYRVRHQRTENTRRDRRRRRR
ncbi:hypothetical protein [Bradyrhizobium sp. McL0615]|uniref:hypothetical protein n=1 Tax=Bradyrhizobium sp. McL0615 TaxID=3415673 RepID=UPI003CF3AC4F